MKRLKYILTLLVMMSLTSIKAFAYDFEVDGIYYDVVSLDELTCKVVSGNERYEGDIVIPATVNYGNRTLTVVEIANDAFEYASGLTGLTIPNTISSISDISFYNGLELEHVTIEDGETALNIDRALRYIAVKTLYLGRNLLFRTSNVPFNTTLIKEVTIGNSVTKIDDNVFLNCSSLTNVTIPNSVTEIGNSAFWGCSDLTSMEIPNSVTKINDYAFYACRGLTSVTIPNSVTEIGKLAFQNCSGLTSVAIGNSVIKIGEDAFNSCSGLKKVIIKDIAAWCGISFDNYFSNPLQYAYHLYSDEETEITDLVIPNSVTKINDYAFCACRGLTSVTIPNSVTEIGEYAFYACI